MMRILLLALLAATALARASDPIDAPADGASATVTQPHVTAELIPETTTVQAGQPFDVALHLHTDPGWHTYWINPGDAGLATSIKWTLPPGFTAGPIQWPTPEKHAMGPAVTYGYAGDVYLLTTITPPKGDLPQHFDVKAVARWLVCQEECIPGKAELTVSLDSGLLNLRLPKENKELFAQARERLPAQGESSLAQSVYAEYAAIPTSTSATTTKDGILIHFKNDGGAPQGHLRFFPEQPNVLSTQDADNLPPVDDPNGGGFILAIALQQNGDKPKSLSGVLVSDQPIARQLVLDGLHASLGSPTNAVYISEFPLSSVVAAAVRSGGSGAGEAQLPGQVRSQVQLGNEGGQGQLPVAPGNPDNKLSGPPEGTEGVASPSGRPGTPGAPVLPGSSHSSGTTGSDQSSPAQPLLITILVFAFIGGLILNLMPCVLPVLSLKVFSLMKHAGKNAKSAWIQGLAFTMGVLVSFWALAGLLIILRTAGNHLGWGFQMQSPGFVLFLILLFFILGLNLFGVFELGTSLVGLDAKTTNHLGGLASSFGNGALATLAATPCTAPFMGSALGFAAQQPAYISLLIFTFLALGMATPYLLLTIFPGALRFVPKPGAWMEAFKQFMGFLLMATVIFLVYVFGSLVGGDQVPWLLFVLLLASIAAWIYGKWGTPYHSTPVRFAAYILTFGIFGYAIFCGVGLAKTDPPPHGGGYEAATTDGWQPWSQDAVDATLAKGQPAFVDFTAAWCLSCKVNERVALGTDAVKQAFAQKNVALFRADWTHSDPAISQTLQKFNRDGVPLYLLYSPARKDAPQVLPEVLTPGIVLDALGKL